MALIGYARVSTGDQTLDLQRDALREAGCLDIYEEQASGARVARPVLAAAIPHLPHGRCPRGVEAGPPRAQYQAPAGDCRGPHAAGRGVKTLTGYAIDTSTPHGKLALHMFAALAEYERALIQERIMAGIAAARARGRKGGRKPKLSPEQQQHAAQMAQGGMPITAIAQTLGVSRHTVYKALAQVGAEVGQDASVLFIEPNRMV